MIIVNTKSVKRDIETAKENLKCDPVDLAVEAIEVDICDRASLKRAWANIDDEVILSIKAHWRAIIEECFNIGSTK